MRICMASRNVAFYSTGRFSVRVFRSLSVIEQSLPVLLENFDISIFPKYSIVS